MHIGIVRETLPRERRVALTPSAVSSLVEARHSVFVETGAGVGAGFPDDDYLAAGAEISWSAREVASRADTLLKIHPPSRAELAQLLSPGALLLAFLHLSSEPPTLRAQLRAKGTTAIALELIEEPGGERPVQETLSAIGGRVAVIIAARHLLVSGGGKGQLMGGVPGVPPLHVVVLGGGAAGESAAAEALRRGARVTVLDRDPRPLTRLARALPQAATAVSNDYTLARTVATADVLIGAVARAGQSAPRLLRRQHIRTLRPGAVFVDMSIDAGGCSETSRVSDPDQPAYEEEGVRHVCIPNLPAEVAHTASLALANVLLPYLLELGEAGVERVVATPGALQRATVFRRGRLVHPWVAEALGEPVEAVEEPISAG